MSLKSLGYPEEVAPGENSCFTDIIPDAHNWSHSELVMIAIYILRAELNRPPLTSEILKWLGWGNSEHELMHILSRYSEHKLVRSVIIEHPYKKGDKDAAHSIDVNSAREQYGWLIRGGHSGHLSSAEFVSRLGDNVSVGVVTMPFICVESSIFQLQQSTKAYLRVKHDKNGEILWEDRSKDQPVLEEVVCESSETSYVTPDRYNEWMQKGFWHKYIDIYNDDKSSMPSGTRITRATMHSGVWIYPSDLKSFMSLFDNGYVPATKNALDNNWMPHRAYTLWGSGVRVLPIHKNWN